MLEEDGSGTEVIGGGRKYAGGKNSFKGGVVGMQSFECVFVICMEFWHPTSQYTW